MATEWLFTLPMAGLVGAGAYEPGSTGRPGTATRLAAGSTRCRWPSVSHPRSSAPAARTRANRLSDPACTVQA
jgi:hypothetical protein